MLRPEVDWNLCKACQPCKARQACKPRAIIKMGSDEPIFIELSRCNGCGVCVTSCAFDAIVMRDTSVASANALGCLPFR